MDPLHKTERRNGGNMGAGISTAGLVAGGDLGPALTGNTEEWNGSSWSTGGTLISGRNHSMAG